MIVYCIWSSPQELEPGSKPVITCPSSHLGNSVSLTKSVHVLVVVVGLVSATSLQVYWYRTWPFWQVPCSTANELRARPTPQSMLGRSCHAGAGAGGGGDEGLQ